MKKDDLRTLVVFGMILLKTLILRHGIEPTETAAIAGVAVAGVAIVGTT